MDLSSCQLKKYDFQLLPLILGIIVAASFFLMGSPVHAAVRGGYCGDGVCDSTTESSSTCSADCGASTTITYGAYYCDTTTYQCSTKKCISGTTGCYSDATTCANNCKAPATYGYTCNTSTYQCSSCVIGTAGCNYSDLTSCQSGCQAPTRYGYACNTSTYQCSSCVIGTAGCNYSDLTSCQSGCQAPTKYGYTCNTSTYQCSSCVIGTAGCSFSDLTSCQSGCQNTNTIQLSSISPSSGLAGTIVGITSGNSGFTSTGNIVYLRNTSTGNTTSITNTTALSSLKTGDAAALAFLSGPFAIAQTEAAGGYNILRFTIPSGLPNGLYDLTVKNGAGEDSIDPPLQFSISNDSTPPDITAAPSSANSNSPISVLLQASDTGGSGLLEARYMLDAAAGDGVGFTFTASTTVTINRTTSQPSETHYISVWARDNAGNTFSHTFQPFTITTTNSNTNASNSNQNNSISGIDIGSCIYTLDQAKVQSGTLFNWLRDCGPAYKQLLANRNVPIQVDLTAPFDTIVSAVSIPQLYGWVPTYSGGNIQNTIGEELQRSVCTLTAQGVPFSTLVTSYHLNDLPFPLSNSCSGSGGGNGNANGTGGGTSLDQIRPWVNVNVTQVINRPRSTIVRLTAKDNVGGSGIQDAAYEINTPVSSSTASNKHFTDTINAAIPDGGTLHWYAKDKAGNEARGTFTPNSSGSTEPPIVITDPGGTTRQCETNTICIPHPLCSVDTGGVPCPPPMCNTTTVCVPVQN